MNSGVLGGKSENSEVAPVKPVGQNDGLNTSNRRVTDPSSKWGEGDATDVNSRNETSGPASPKEGSKDQSALTESDLASLNAVLGHQIAENTKRSYETQWRRFVRWTSDKQLESLPANPVHVAVYLAERLEAEGHKPATLRAAAAAVSYAHRSASLEDPCASTEVKDALKSATRKAGRNQRQAEALTADALQLVRATAQRPRRARGGKLETPETATQRGAVDIAIISLMRDAMLRVSEAASLRWGDLTSAPDGTGRLLLRRSKTDVEGESVVLFVSQPTMSDLALVHEAASERHSMFGLSRDQISRRIKRAAREAGLGEGFSGHSPRVGMAQDLARAGTELPRLMTAGRWRSPRMPALYIRNETAARGAVAQYYGDRPIEAGEVTANAGKSRETRRNGLITPLQSDTLCRRRDTESHKELRDKRRVTATISETRSESESRAGKARPNGQSAASGELRDFAKRYRTFKIADIPSLARGFFTSQTNGEPGTDFRDGSFADLCQVASAVVKGIIDRPLLAFLTFRCLPLAVCIVVVGQFLSFLDWNESWMPAFYVCIITAIVMAHTLLFTQQDVELREFFWVSLFYMLSAPMLQFAPIHMDHYSLYRVGDFAGTHMPFMFALLINLGLAGTAGFLFHLLSTRLPPSGAGGITPLKRGMATVLPPLGIVYAVVIVLSNASIWIQFAVMVPAVAVSFTTMLVLRDTSIDPTPKDRLYLLIAASAAAIVSSALGVFTIMFIYVSPDLPQVLPDHNLLRSWEIDFSQLGFTKQEALARLNIGYVWHATFAFAYLGFVVGGNLLVAIFQMGGRSSHRPAGSPASAFGQVTATDSSEDEVPTTTSGREVRGEDDGDIRDSRRLGFVGATRS